MRRIGSNTLLVWSAFSGAECKRKGNCPSIFSNFKSFKHFTDNYTVKQLIVTQVHVPVLVQTFWKCDTSPQPRSQWLYEIKSFFTHFCLVKPDVGWCEEADACRLLSVNLHRFLYWIYSVFFNRTFPHLITTQPVLFVILLLLPCN